MDTDEPEIDMAPLGRRTWFGRHVVPGSGLKDAGVLIHSPRFGVAGVGRHHTDILGSWFDRKEWERSIEGRGAVALQDLLVLVEVKGIEGETVEGAEGKVVAGHPRENRNTVHKHRSPTAAA